MAGNEKICLRSHFRVQRNGSRSIAMLYPRLELRSKIAVRQLFSKNQLACLVLSFEISQNFIEIAFDDDKIALTGSKLTVNRQACDFRAIAGSNRHTLDR